MDLLLQIGRRVLVVADSHGRMNALCEIREPEEVALLVGNTRSAAESVEKSSRFGSALRKAAEPFEDGLPGLPARLTTTTTTTAATDTDRDGDTDLPDPTDVNGLLTRVREMRQQFKSA